ncbi:hypothetical protein B296_00051037 [Ensete ventricosum]|uniref:Uncharacterized protein n=1 Tax=Ensete ventricosum TaxID=4639 RepID=A0A426WVI7_ENSVE|nr:hypothetical protein B296_00051037 [Ensete ventricosum]
MRMRPPPCRHVASDCPLRPSCGRQPLAAWPRATAPFGLAAGDHHLWVPPCSLPPCGHDAAGGYRPYGLVAAPVGGRPFRAGLGRGLAVGGRPCMGVGRGWPHLLLAAFAAKCSKNT